MTTRNKETAVFVGIVLCIMALTLAFGPDCPNVRDCRAPSWIR